MDKSIKTRSAIKDIKTLTKKAGVTHSIKNTGIKARDTAEDVTASKAPRTRDGRTYAENKVESGISEGTGRVACSAANQAKGAATRVIQAQKLTKDAAQTTARRTAKNASAVTTNAARKAVKVSTKSSSKSMKTIGRSTRTTVKTASHAPQAVKTAATASRATARSAGYATRAGARTATLGTKVAARATTAFVKMAIAAAKSLGAAIAAVGGTAVAAIVIICLVALIAVSAFGIFFTGGDWHDPLNLIQPQC